MNPVLLSDKNSHDYVKISGPDSRSFLQGQLTCNLDHLSSERSLRGALCNLKGRVVADFRLLQTEQEVIMLQCSSGIGEKIIDILSRYAVFSKVELAVAEGPAAVCGLIGSTLPSDLQDLLPALPDKVDEVSSNESALIVREPGTSPRYQIWCHQREVGTALQSEGSGDEADWLRGEILAGVVHVTTVTSEVYTPQLLNYDISGAVDFKKGCYTGQEVVARMHYRAKAKKRLYRLQSAQALAGDSMIATQQEPEVPVVELLLVAPANGDEERNLGLGIVSTELAESANPLILNGNPEQVVEVVPLEYCSEAP
ncbi:MAG: hypothetical protein RL839_01080 [Gammaproteobacteria bacterium]